VDFEESLVLMVVFNSELATAHRSRDGLCKRKAISTSNAISDPSQFLRRTSVRSRVSFLLLFCLCILTGSSHDVHDYSDGSAAVKSLIL
jgi:hypothetical protein